MNVRNRILLLLLIVFSVAGFQTVNPTATPQDPNVNITWPPPIYVLTGEFSVRGTANLPDMASYFLEFRPLNEDLTPADDTVEWSPAILPARGPVSDDVLGVWDTSTVPDGAYELRLTINPSSGTPVHAVVSPLRVENDPPPFAITPTVPPSLPAATSAPQEVPTLIPTPTALSTNPEAVAVTNGNVRAGDNTSYGIIGSLTANQTVPVVGRSNSGSGWWLIELPDGQRGWVAPSIVRVTGDLSTLPRVDPPSTPTPVASPTPDLPDAVITNVRFDRDIVEGENFHVIVTVYNASGVPLPRTPVACNFTPMDDFYSSFIEGLNGYTQIEVAMVVNLSEGGGGNITANCAVDLNNAVPEVDENNNYFNLTERLANPDEDDDE